MKDILFVIPTLGEGGAERALLNLVNNLDSSKFKITIFTLFDVGLNRDKLNKNIRHKYFFKWMFRGNIHVLKLFSPEFLFKIMIKEDYDIIISYLEGPTTRIVSGNTHSDRKIVSWVHTDIVDEKVITDSYRSYNEAIASYKKYDETIFVSETSKESFGKIFYKDDASQKVIYNVVDTRDIRLKSHEIMDDIIFDDKQINLISMGTFKEVKGFMRLISIVNKLVKQGTNVHLYLLGKGPQEEQYKNFIVKNNLEDHVTIIGYRINPFKYIKAADIFVASSFREGYSTAVTEALILEKPVITTLCSGMEELLGHNNEYGIIVNNDEESLFAGLEELLGNEETYNYYKNKVKERAQYFSIEQSVTNVERMLNNL